ncbi:DUF6408 family protein [Streptomyces pseudovenezuelae]
MNPVECKSARRLLIRRIMVDVAVGVVTNLLVTGLTAAARLVF